jgi:hypothetical protein
MASLVEASWTGRAVRTRWTIPEDRVSLALERNDGADWRVLGPAEPRAGLFEQEDGSITRGRRYGYRLADAEGSPVSDEAWITVPARAELDVQRVGPNPGVGPLRLAVSTPGGIPLRLELLDVAGRVIDRRVENDLFEGRHAITLAEGRRLAAGCYFVRLTSNGQRKVRSVILLR